MQKVEPILFRTLKPEEYTAECERINFEINQISDHDFLKLITSDIPFRVYFMQIMKGDFAGLIKESIAEQRQSYKLYLYCIYQFPQTTYQRN